MADHRFTITVTGGLSAKEARAGLYLRLDGWDVESVQIEPVAGPISLPKGTTEVEGVHVFSLGAQHEVCERCGCSLRGTFYGCPGSVESAELMQKLLIAARARGFEEGRGAAGRKLQAKIAAVRHEGGVANEAFARHLWDVARDLPHWGDV